MRLVSGVFKRAEPAYSKHWQRRSLVLIAAWFVLTLVSTWVLVRFDDAPLGEPTRSLQTAQNFVSTATLLGRPAAGLSHYVFNIEHATYSLITCAVGWSVWFAALVVILQLRDEAHHAWRKRVQTKIEVVSSPADATKALSRRELLADIGIATSSALAAGALYKSCAVDAWELKTRSYTVPIADLPRSLNNLRIVQISDTHLGTRVNAEFIRECVARAIDLQPDLIALTGDYIHNGTNYIDDAAKLFQPLFDNLTFRAGGKPIPSLAVLGNHDWYGDSRMMSRALQQRGAYMLDNDRVFLNANTREIQSTPPREGLCLAGLGDYLEDVIRPDLALANIPRHMPRILLSHNPDTAEDPRVIVPARRVDLQLSGHTHGGQVRLPVLGTPIIPSRYGSKYAGGFVNGPAFPVIISRGVGTSGIPVRWHVPAEVVVIELTCG